MKQLCVVVVLIWFICVNENYLFTRVDRYSKLETFQYGDRYNISCGQSVINIESISVEDENTACALSEQCNLTDDNMNDIKSRCNGFSTCIPNIQLSPTCMIDNSYFNLTYVCSASDMACNFEKSVQTCDWYPSSGWKRRNGSNDEPRLDVTTKSGHGNFLYTDTTSTLTSGPVKSSKTKCLVFWYNTNVIRQNPILTVNQASSSFNTALLWTLRTEDIHTWKQIKQPLHNIANFTIVFKAHLNQTGKEYIALDDIELLNKPCDGLKTTFEKGLEGWNNPDYNERNWTLQKAGQNISDIQPATDYTTESERGFYLYFQDSGSGRVESPTLTSSGNSCLILWYYMIGDTIDSLKIIQRLDGHLRFIKNITDYAQGKWNKQHVFLNIKSGDKFEIIFEGTLLNGSESCIAVDDISIIDGACQDQKDDCISITREYKTRCPKETPFYRQFAVTIEPNDDTTNDCYNTKYNLQRNINVFCEQENNTNNDCAFSLEQFISGDEIQKRCLQFSRNIVLHYTYYCIHVDMSSVFTVASTSGERDDITMDFQSSSPSSTPILGITERLPSGSPSSTPVIGIVVGVVLSLVVLTVFLVIAVVYFRRSRYAEKKGHSIVLNEDSRSDYTGHQNVAFSPKVNGNTQTDYCEIRKSKHNEHYHDISDTFGPSINTANDDEYTEIAHVVNSPNSNPNASTNYQHQYISLDPKATGFNRSNPQTNLHNEIKNIHNSNEKTSSTSTDDYAILEPNDLNESKKNTPKVLPLSDNYVVLDPNETGFNRQENTDRVCNYELSTAINPTETSEDPYDVSKDETYDTSSNSRQEKENNIYNHTVDNVYDTAGNQRKKDENDGTYDHFVGQKSEDDYDISKPI